MIEGTKQTARRTPPFRAPDLSLAGTTIIATALPVGNPERDLIGEAASLRVDSGSWPTGEAVI